MCGREKLNGIIMQGDDDATNHGMPFYVCRVRRYQEEILSIVKVCFKQRTCL